MKSNRITSVGHSSNTLVACCPVRVQRKRVKGWKMPENTVYVGRPTKYGNPYQLPVACTDELRKEQIDKYRELVTKKNLWSEPNTMSIIKELKGKNLACFCPLDKPCHADVLLEIANR